MKPMPRLLETYEEARLLLEAKGWGVSKAADHLFALPELAGFNLSSSSFSRKTAPGSKFPIEPEVAAAIQSLETRVGYERQTDIITRGLLALHGDPPIVDVDRLAAELREHLPAGELALKLVEALEEKSGQRLTRLSQKLAERSASELTPKLVEVVGALAERLGRVSGKQIAISAGSGALVALLLVPLMSAAHAFSTGSLAVMVPVTAAPDHSPVWLRFEPGSPLDRSEWGEKVPAEQYVPMSTLPGQAVAPCRPEEGEEDIYGNCWVYIASVKPPCGNRGVLFRHGDKCYRAIAAEQKKPPAP